CHLELLLALDVAHEGRKRRVHGDDDVALAECRRQLRRVVVGEPEAADEADLDGPVPLGRKPRRHVLEGRQVGQAGGSDADLAHAPSLVRPTRFLPSFPWPRSPRASICWSSTSTSASPISGGRRRRSRSGTSRSWRRSCAPPTARATATPSPRNHLVPSVTITATGCPAAA